MNQELEALLKEVARTVQSDARRRNLGPDIQQRLAASATADLRPTRSRRWAWAIGGGGVLVASAVAVLLVLSRPRALTFVAVTGDDGREIAAGRLGASFGGDAAGARGVGLRFSDGSRVTLPADTRAVVEGMDANGATLALTRGTAEVFVVHRANTHWQLRAGRYEIRVTGTRFGAGWDPLARMFTLVMHEGSVVVSGPGLKAPLPVAAGQHLQLRDDTGTAPELAPPRPNESPAPEPEPERAEATRGQDQETIARSAQRCERAPSARPRADGQPQVSPASPPASPLGASWRALAGRAKYKDALAAALKKDHWPQELAHGNAEDVVSLGDVARLAGDVERAEEAYRTALRRFPSLDRPVFSLGRMAFEQRHDYLAAAQWFASYVQQFPHGALIAEAAGRLLEARLATGDTAAAHAEATRYLRAYPTGPHAALARRILAP